MKKLGFVQVGKSHLTLWHKPGLKEVKSLKEQLGITLVVCLLYDKENPFPVLEEYEAQGLKFIRIPMKGANENTLQSDETVETVITQLKELYTIANETEHRILIYCSAGIHRTGTIAYTILRQHGNTPE